MTGPEKVILAKKTGGRAAVIMLQGTSSDAGKSLLAAALCRIFRQDGLRPAPFKAQNMSLNSCVTPDGREIGRAQGMQADACGIPATTDMNPILLKPKRDMEAQVVVHGKPYRDMDARTYRESYLPEAEKVVKEALERLRAAFDVVVIEGAGSPAEVNLKDRDVVNMRLAGWADAPVLLVADIDRGGMFASVVGTMEILEPEERARVRGVIVNKFRGDASLLRSGLEWLEARIGKPVLGVIPYIPGLALEDEDSASLDARGPSAASSHGGFADGSGCPDGGGVLDIAVLRLPRLANYTDFDPLLGEPGVRLRFVSSVEGWGRPDIVILPGSKNTVADLRFLYDSGLAWKMLAHAERGGRLLAICAGYQMLGRRLLDPLLVESDIPEIEGLGLIPAETVFTADKRTERVAGVAKMPFFPGGEPVEGYEIHMGRTRFLEPVRHPFRIRTVRAGRSGLGAGAGAIWAGGGSADIPAEPHADEPYMDGYVSADGKIWATYIHGILHNDGLRLAWLNDARREKGLPGAETALPFRERRERSFDRLARLVREHLDMERVYRILNKEDAEP